MKLWKIWNFADLRFNGQWWVNGRRIRKDKGTLLRTVSTTCRHQFHRMLRLCESVSDLQLYDILNRKHKNEFFCNFFLVLMLILARFTQKFFADGYAFVCAYMSKCKTSLNRHQRDRKPSWLCIAERRLHEYSNLG